MWNKKIGKPTKLSKELLIIFLLDLGISVFTLFFLDMIAKGILFSYCDNNNIYLSEIQEYNYLSLILAASIALAAIEFTLIFLILVGQKLSYLQEIMAGIDSLTAHRLNYEIPIRDNNEFTELAKAINYMSKTELELNEKERKLASEKENFIRAMSHDIRTPLTAIISHTQYLSSKRDALSPDEITDYLSMVEKKALQMKELSNMLLDENNNNKQYIHDGKLLLVQLADEWLEDLEESFSCNVHIDDSLAFSGNYIIQDFQRIFDNLSSNIKKYAEPSKEISLEIKNELGYLTISQSNYKATKTAPVESHKIGIESIARIANKYGGDMRVHETEDTFNITITLFSI